MSLNKIGKTVGTVSLAVALGLGAGVAQAKDQSYMVTYSNAELASPNGVVSVHERIRKAAKRYCPKYSQVRSVAEINACVDDVVTDLVSKVNHPQLTSLHESGSAVAIAGTNVRQKDRS